VENGVLGLQFETPPEALKGLGQGNCVEQAGRAALGRPVEKVNARNNEPSPYLTDDQTLASLFAKCREKTWPHLKNSTRQHY
jgi:hypothetical protein